MPTTLPVSKRTRLAASRHASDRLHDRLSHIPAQGTTEEPSEGTTREADNTHNHGTTTSDPSQKSHGDTTHTPSALDITHNLATTTLATQNLPEASTHSPATSQETPDARKPATADNTSQFICEQLPCDIFCDPNNEADPEITCDHPITVSLAVEHVYQLTQQLYEPAEGSNSDIVCLVQKKMEIKWSDGVWSDMVKENNKGVGCAC
ncbi:hypothetical protein BDV12DRAFT_172174 [Aspergillus spectabilis]